jgi:hypothetical protein
MFLDAPLLQGIHIPLFLLYCVSSTKLMASVQDAKYLLLYIRLIVTIDVLLINVNEWLFPWHGVVAEVNNRKISATMTAEFLLKKLNWVGLTPKGGSKEKGDV